MNRYETNSKGTAPALSALLNKFADMPRSAFDETRRKVFDAFPFGIIPVECFLMFPNSDMYVKYDISAITKNPTIRRILSSMNIETRTYVCKCSDLWEGWNNFITRGRSGKVNLSIPKLKFTHTCNGVTRSTSLPYNPYSYLNIAPPASYRTSQNIYQNYGFYPCSNTDWDKTGLINSTISVDSIDSTVLGECSALPGVMYCKCAKEYQNPNLLQNNPYWYPENENHDLILPYNATSCTTACYDYPQAIYDDYVNTVKLENQDPSNDKKSMPWLNVLYRKQRKGNYFNTGSPFPDLIRGDVPTLDVLSGNVDFTNAILDNTSAYLEAFVGIDLGTNKLGAGTGIKNTAPWDGVSGNTNYPDIENYNNQKLLAALNKNTVKNISFSMSEWRRLATMTVFKERMARTDGSYNQMIQAQFQHNPKWHEHSVKYCGGSVQPIVFSEVVQTSENGTTPLGTTGGRAVSSSGNNEISIHVDDYSIMMTVLTITPDDYYTQGIDRMWSELTQAEQYFPILNNLNPQAIKNKELYVSGTNATDEDVFNYQELFSHFKSRQNQVSGLMSLPISKVGDTGAYIFNRLFNSTPNFNNAFVTGSFTDNENLTFSSTIQAQFVLSVISQMKYVAPIPAITQPSDMGLSY